MSDYKYNDGIVKVENVKYKHIKRLLNSSAIDYILLIISSIYAIRCYTQGNKEGAIFLAFFTVFNLLTIVLYNDKILRRINEMRLNIRALKSRL